MEYEVKAGDVLTNGSGDGGFEFGEFWEKHKKLIIGLLVVVVLVIIFTLAFKDRFAVDPINEWTLSNYLYYQGPNQRIGGQQ